PGSVRHRAGSAAPERPRRDQSAAVRQRQANRKGSYCPRQAGEYRGEGIKMNDRRDFLKTAGAALTTSIFTGNVRGANDRIRVAFIGTGRMGTESMRTAINLRGVEVPFVCDVYQPNLEKAVALSGHGPDNTPDAHPKAKGITDFREILHDKSIDAVNISTPDHWHAY